MVCGFAFLISGLEDRPLSRLGMGRSILPPVLQCDIGGTKL